MTEARLVLVTAPDADVARALARRLVEERLAACANLVGGLTSVFRWQDAVHEEPEVLLLIKTTEARFDALRERVAELHPYDVPEVLSLRVDDGLGAYLEWLGDCVSPKKEA